MDFPFTDEGKQVVLTNSEEQITHAWLNEPLARLLEIHAQCKKPFVGILLLGSGGLWPSLRQPELKPVI